MNNRISAFWKVSFLLFLSTFLRLEAQNVKSMIIPLGGISSPKEINKDYFSHFQYVAPFPGGSPSQSILSKVKDAIPQRKFEEERKFSKTSTPPAVPLRNFEGNRFKTGTPNDNDMAISNDGYIVSVVNQSVCILDSVGTLLKTFSFDAFCDTLKISENKYDGKVVYDPINDRFISTILSGYVHDKSFIIVSFSKTGNPLDGWNHYALSGNPLNDTSWSDYPIVAITKNHYFLTLNLLTDNKTWQAGFKQSILWQVDLKDGYSGNSLKSKVYSGFNYSGKPIRNLCPAQGGLNLENGNELFLVSNLNFSPSNDSIFLIKIEPLNSKIISINAYQGNAKYGVSPTARQTKPKFGLQTNDARFLDAIIVPPYLYAVGNSVTSANSCGISFLKIDLSKSNISPEIKIIEEPNMDVGFPSLAAASLKNGDDDILITANYTSDKEFPGLGAFYYLNGEFSPLTIIKKGSSFISTSQQPDRWGDYSGCQRRYNHPGRVWIAGTYGQKVLSKGITNYTSSTWISELAGANTLIGIEDQKKNISKVKIYPNPMEEFQEFVMEFEANSPDYFSANVLDINGKFISNLLNSHLKVGLNSFRMNSNALGKGTYFIQIQGKQLGLIKTQKLIVE